MLKHWLLNTDTFAAPQSLSTLQQSLPLEWVELAFGSTDKASIRRRKLPAELVVWLVVAMGHFRDRSISEVVTKLDLSLQNSAGGNRGSKCNPSGTTKTDARTISEAF